MGEVKQIEIKNRTYYFYNDIINLEKFESNLLKIDKKSYKNIDIYYIGYITIKKNNDCENINSVNPLYLQVNHASGYIGEKNGNKYLVFDSTDESKDLLKKYTDVWDGIRDEIKAMNSGKKFLVMNIIIRSVFEEDGKLYSQLFLDDTLYELV